MQAEREDQLDEKLRRAVAELQRPVSLGAEVDAHALDRIRADAAGWPASRHGRRWGAWIAGGAIAAGLGFLLLSSGEIARTSKAAAPVAVVAVPADARPVSLHLNAPASSRVAVVGDFNDWDPAATPLRPAGRDGGWVVELRLKPGRYHYTFLIDGRRWERDPAEPQAPGSDFGPPVSVLTVI